MAKERSHDQWQNIKKTPNCKDLYHSWILKPSYQGKAAIGFPADKCPYLFGPLTLRLPPETTIKKHTQIEVVKLKKIYPVTGWLHRFVVLYRLFPNSLRCARDCWQHGTATAYFEETLTGGHDIKYDTKTTYSLSCFWISDCVAGPIILGTYSPISSWKTREPAVSRGPLRVTKIQNYLLAFLCKICPQPISFTVVCLSFCVIPEAFCI